MNCFDSDAGFFIPPETTPTLPLLVTGLAGVPGFSAFRHFNDLYPGQVIGVRRPDLWALKGPGIVGCDLEDADQVARLWDRYGFRSVINAIGSCRLKSCEFDPSMAHRVNVQTTTNVIRQAAQSDSRVIHLSIDLVFAGRDGGGYSEHDTTDPVTVYGHSMVAAESAVLSARPEATVLRISLPMGVSFNGHAGAIDWIESRFIKDKPATLYFDEIRTPSYTTCLNTMFQSILGRDLPGVFHAGGSRRLSLYEIAQIVNVVGGYDSELLIGCPRIDAGPMPPRAGDVTMDSAKIASHFAAPPMLGWPADERLVPTDRDWHRQSHDWIHPGREQVKRLLYHPGVIADEAR